MLHLTTQTQEQKERAALLATLLTVPRYDDCINDRLTLAEDAYAVGWEAAISQGLAPLSEDQAGDVGHSYGLVALDAGVKTDSREWFLALFSWQFMTGYTDCCRP